MKRVILLLILLSTGVCAQESMVKKEITLIALAEKAGNQSGTIATLGLELIPGSERVFLETFPMTKVSTQASLRFAQQITCKELDIDCSQYDFLFTIRALPGLVGGPSAGSAASALVAAALLDKPVPQHIATTGTINSGGVIGSVGGLNYKIEAAAEKNISTVLIPKGTKVFEFQNKTINLIEYGKGLGVDVREVATLSELLEIMFGIPQPDRSAELHIDERYSRIMRDVATDLCTRNEEFAKENRQSIIAENFTARGKAEFDKGSFYASASYCFRSNVEYKRNWFKDANLSTSELQKRLSGVQDEVDKLLTEVEKRNITTLTDLQTFMAVMERVNEVNDQIPDSEEKLKANDSSVAPAIGYLEERIFSAVTWARFFDGKDEKIDISEKMLQDSCAAKISEAEERYNYLKTLLSEALSGTRDEINQAYEDFENGKYIMCLYGAAKAKAEADVVLSVIGVKEERLDDAIELELLIARDALMKAQQKNVFPIIAHSYYEYAQSLREFDQTSALLFGEYSLELANLDIYFPKQKKQKRSTVRITQSVIPVILIAGIMIGIAISIAFMTARAQARRKIKKSRSTKSKRVSSRRKFKTLQTPPKKRLRGKKR